jgi:hypothetical protein
MMNMYREFKPVCGPIVITIVIRVLQRLNNNAQLYLKWPTFGAFKFGRITSRPFDKCLPMDAMRIALQETYKVG